MRIQEIHPINKGPIDAFKSAIKDRINVVRYCQKNALIYSIHDCETAGVIQGNVLTGTVLVAKNGQDNIIWQYPGRFVKPALDVKDIPW